MDITPSRVSVSDPRELAETIAGLLAAQPLAVLSTSENGQPYCSLVAFAQVDGIRYLAFATSRSTRKFANLVRDPRVSLLVDDRSNQESDFQGAMAVTATGRAHEIPEGERARFLKHYLAKHPQLEEFVLSPECALVGVRVSRYTVVRQFQNVAVLDID